MSQQDLLRRVVKALDSAAIDYMITGSIASSLQGEPRATHDLDVVVRNRSGFNVIETAEGDKVDFGLLTDDAFDQSRFARKYEENVFGIRLKVSAPEDTIPQKLRWSALSGGSEKLYGDALRVYEVQHARLDQQYLDEWSRSLGTEGLLARIRDEAELI